MTPKNKKPAKDWVILLSLEAYNKDSFDWAYSLYEYVKSTKDD